MMKTNMSMLMLQQQIFCFFINDSSFVVKSIINFVLNVKLNEYIFFNLLCFKFCSLLCFITLGMFPGHAASSWL